MVNTYFEEIKKDFGFGCMRFSVNGDNVYKIIVAGGK